MSALNVKSYSQLKSLLQGEAETDHSGEEAHAKVMNEVFKNYYEILASLSKDSMNSVSEKAKLLTEACRQFHKESARDGSRRHEEDLTTLINEIGAAAEALAGKDDIAAARIEFGKLSEKLIEYQKRHITDESARANVFVCDMAKKMWLQKDEAPGNPYYGVSMAMCRRKVQ